MAQVPGTTYAYNSNSNVNMNTQRASGMPNIADNGADLAITTTNIDLFANGQRVGMIQAVSPSENRTITKVQELGSEGVVQSVAANTNGGQLSVTRLAVYNSNLWNALGLTDTGQFQQLPLDTQNSATPGSGVTAGYNTFASPFKTLKDQRVPLEIKIRTRIPNGATIGYYEITYLDCWLASYQRSVAFGTITITETASLSYSDVLSAFNAQ